LAAGDIIQVHEYKMHPANTLNRSSGGGGGSYSFQGSSYGYAAGENSYTNVIQKFSLTSAANATDVGDLVTGKSQSAGHTSSSHGYTSGGRSPTATPLWTNAIEKYTFAADQNATSVGTLPVGGYQAGGVSSSDNGYAVGIFDLNTPIRTNTIQKFPFSSDTNGSDVADLTQSRVAAGGTNSTENGYTSGGHTGPSTSSNVIDKFPFSSDTNATDVGDLTSARGYVVAQSSAGNGYSSGGQRNGPPTDPTTRNSNIIDKFPFSSDTNATDVGDLIQEQQYTGAGVSSTADGYVTGGFTGGPNVCYNTIQKFPFSSDTNATDVADLLSAAYGQAGAQV
jgi:hypothetical protein